MQPLPSLPYLPYFYATRRNYIFLRRVLRVCGHAVTGNDNLFQGMIGLDLTDQRFGRLLAVRQDGKNHRMTKHGHASGHTVTPEYGSWANMMSRCYKPNRREFKWYGARGIQVCLRWHSSTPDAFQNFLSDMGFKPSRSHTLDRINNDGHYMPSNCRWVTRDIQNNNKRQRRPLCHAPMG